MLSVLTIWTNNDKDFLEQTHGYHFVDNFEQFFYILWYSSAAWTQKNQISSKPC